MFTHLLYHSINSFFSTLHSLTSNRHLTIIFKKSQQNLVKSLCMISMLLFSLCYCFRKAVFVSGGDDDGDDGGGGCGYVDDEGSENGDVRGKVGALY